jgi:hypothetical protein
MMFGLAFCCNDLDLKKEDHGIRLSPNLFRFCPNPRRLAIAEEFKMDHIGIATDRAILDVSLLRAGGWIERNYDPFAAGRADV